jgi:predicted RNA-binding Zn ribbon-like protein
MSHLRLVPGRDRVEWAWSGERLLDDVAWRVARSAADLLTTADLALVRECAADTCGWLFLDRSRNRSRRWCDMNVGGNRAKVRRHYLKTKGAA